MPGWLRRAAACASRITRSALSPFDRLDRDPAAEALVPGAMDGPVTAAADPLADREPAQYALAFDHGDRFAAPRSPPAPGRCLPERIGRRREGVDPAGLGDGVGCRRSGAGRTRRTRSTTRSPASVPAARASRLGRRQRSADPDEQPAARNGWPERRSEAAIQPEPALVADPDAERFGERRVLDSAAAGTPRSPPVRRGACCRSGSGSRSAALVAGGRRRGGRRAGSTCPSRRGWRSRDRSRRPRRGASSAPSRSTAGRHVHVEDRPLEPGGGRTARRPGAARGTDRSSPARCRRSPRPPRRRRRAARGASPAPRSRRRRGTRPTPPAPPRCRDCGPWRHRSARRCGGSGPARRRSPRGAAGVSSVEPSSTTITSSVDVLLAENRRERAGQQRPAVPGRDHDRDEIVCRILSDLRIRGFSVQDFGRFGRFFIESVESRDSKPPRCANLTRT